MNIPEVYLVEPYNAYAPKGRKKHWHEVIEEQALLARILAEQQALQEAQSKTLPPNTPDISSPTVGNMNAGAGGLPVYAYFHPDLESVDFSATPLAAVAGTTAVVFTNLTPTPQFDTYLWDFNDGTTSTEISPTHTFPASASYTVQLQRTSSNGHMAETTKTEYVLVDAPTLTVNFTVVTASGDIAPVTASFTNATTYNGAGTLTYKWDFGDSTTSSLASPTHYYDLVGEFAVRLSVTESLFGSSSFKSLVGGVTGSAPTVIAAFTVVTSSNIAPLTASFTNISTTNGTGPLTYLWDFGDTTTSSLASPTKYYQTGSFNVRLSVTESKYDQADSDQMSGWIGGGITGSAPTVTSGFTVTGASVTLTASYYSASVADVLTFTATSTTNNGQPLTYQYLFMSGSAPEDYSSSVASVSTQTFVDAGTYGVLLSTTGSYGIATAGVRNILFV